MELNLAFQILSNGQRAQDGLNTHIPFTNHNCIPLIYRGSYRRYRPRSNNSTSGSVESILRGNLSSDVKFILNSTKNMFASCQRLICIITGTTNKWISMARKSAQNKQILKALTLSSADVVKELDTSPCLRVEVPFHFLNNN